MTTYYWQGGADAIAAVHTASIDTVDATPSNNTYTITVGDDSVSAAGNTSATQTAADLVGLANGNTVGPHMAVVTFANPSGANITATADVAGVPFSATLSVTGAGNGTVTTFAETIANAGPASAATVANYIDGNGTIATSLPTAGDTVVLRNSDGNVSYDLGALTGNGINLIVEQSYSGLIGLDDDSFARGADGGNTTTTAREYRTPRYLEGNWSSVVIGRHTGTGSPTGSTRTMISSTYTAASGITVENTASSSADNFKPPVRLLIGNANTDVFVERAPGGVGIAVDRAGETSTVGDVSIAGASTTVVIGSGTTCSNFTQAGGSHKIIGAAGNVTEVRVTGGTLDIGGDFLATTITVEGGTVTDRHVNTGGNLATTVNVRAGTYDLQASDATRSIGALTRTGGTVRLNPAVSYTTLDLGRGTVSD